MILLNGNLDFSAWHHDAMLKNLNVPLFYRKNIACEQ